MSRKLVDGPFSRSEILAKLTELYVDSKATDGKDFLESLTDFVIDSHDQHRLAKKVATGMCFQSYYDRFLPQIKDF